MKRLLAAIPLLLAIAISGCAGTVKEPVVPGTGTDTGTASPTPPASPDPIQERLKSMTLDEKLGQLVIAGVNGTKLDPETRSLIEKDRVGGFILYKPNIESVEQTVSFLNELKQANRNNRIPLLLSVDQEGGKVSRLPPPLAALPSSRDIARDGKPERARSIGEAIGGELRAFGFNVNYAPVLDVDSNPNNPVIASRSFGPSAAIVSSYGIELMKGLQHQKVIPVVKHFPGHGDTSVDSHLDLPVVDKTADQLRKLELVPFADAIRAKADSVMIAHILLPDLDPGVPSSMSSKIITGLLRDELGFDGVVMTDDMTMGAITKHYDLGLAAVQSFNAGSDILLVAHEYKNARLVLDALKQAAVSGAIAAERIDRSVTRILTLKQRYELSDEAAGPVDTDKINAAIRQAVGK